MRAADQRERARESSMIRFKVVKADLHANRPAQIESVERLRSEHKIYVTDSQYLLTVTSSHRHDLPRFFELVKLPRVLYDKPLLYLLVCCLAQHYFHWMPGCTS